MHLSNQFSTTCIRRSIQYNLHSANQFNIMAVLVKSIQHDVHSLNQFIRCALNATSLTQRVVNFIHVTCSHLKSIRAPFILTCTQVKSTQLNLLSSQSACMQRTVSSQRIQPIQAHHIREGCRDFRTTASTFTPPTGESPPTPLSEGLNL